MGFAQFPYPNSLNASHVHSVPPINIGHILDKLILFKPVLTMFENSSVTFYIRTDPSNSPIDYPTPISKKWNQGCLLLLRQPADYLEFVN